MRAEFFKNLTGIPLEKQLNLTKGLFEATCASKGPLFNFTETIVCTALLENITICIRPCRYRENLYNLRRPQNLGKSPSYFRCYVCYKQKETDTQIEKQLNR